jgi:hypothetical protein
MTQLDMVSSETKVCMSCEKEKPLQDYYVNPTNSIDGHHARCIPCYKKVVYERRHFNKLLGYAGRAGVRRAKEELNTAPEPRQERQLAMRFNEGKPDYSLIPLHLLEGATRVMRAGAEKYEEWNWARGMPWSTPYACAMRHLSAWYKGETNDSETGENHIDHAICNLLMLKHFAEKYQEGDDRPTLF